MPKEKEEGGDNIKERERERERERESRKREHLWTLNHINI
jgi:hypothetical protein